ncbi:MAG: hypothetical protein ACUVUH_01560, partial [bacterium]
LSEEILLQQLRGIYKVFVKTDSPESVLKRVSAIHSTYFRGVEIETHFIEKEKVRIKHIGFEKRHQLMSFGIISFYKKALEITGAKNVKIKYITPIEGDLGYSELELSWTK